MKHGTKVAVLGLGTMGHAFAANLIKAGFEVWVWNRSPGKDEALVAAGAHRADSPAAAAREVSVLLSMVATADATEQIMFGDQGAAAGLPDGAVVAQMGTIGLEATKRLAARFEAERPDLVLVDAPVSGSKGPAERAQVLILAGGDRQRAQAIEPVFEAISKGTRWLGPVGAGSRMKLVVNAWLVNVMQGTAETALLAEQLGFSTDTLWSVLDGGPLATPYMKPKLDKIAASDFSTEMALDWGLKDARLALESGDAARLPGLAKIAEIWQEAAAAGFGEQDISAVAEYLSRK
ncbi:NAD(P)-dependent oxidoreductase [Halotalea alkalilenta]|uniref:NAD(P)-dependent oxidoreductase n=1 Tax=Halotalea alkalilenta TaxID=376489 RepID=UPI000485925B|nr:NAD(P)-dependent oxidoreductase [Halotalea alkalilenta]